MVPEDHSTLAMMMIINLSLIIAQHRSIPDSSGRCAQIMDIPVLK